MIKGMMTLDELRNEVLDGHIDTVLACQTDMQGRLMGKRFQADYFVDSAWEETHSCNYLQATDMEMETVDGYKSTSWEAGYGDYVMKPDLGTLRRVPWLLRRKGRAAGVARPRAVARPAKGARRPGE